MAIHSWPGWTRNRLEGLLFAFVAIPLVLLHGITWPSADEAGRDVFRNARQRWIRFIARGFSDFRAAWWMQFNLESWPTLFRYVLLLEALEWRNARIAKTRTGSAAAGLRHVLIVQLGHIGDVLMTRPLVKSWKAARPGDRVTCLVGPWCEGWTAAQLGADALLAYAPAVRQFSRDGKFIGCLDEYRLLRELGRHRFNVVVSAGNSHFIDEVIYSATRPGLSCGVASGLALYPAPGNRAMLAYDTTVYEAERIAKLGACCDVPVGDATPKIKSPPAATAAGESDWRAVCDEPCLRVAVAPGAGWPGKIWPPEYFGAVMARIADSRPACFLLLGSPSERPLAERALEKRSIRAASLMGSTSLERAAGILATANVLLTNDNGLLHMAAALGTPTLAIYGPTNPRQWAPRGARHRAVTSDFECGGCHPWHPSASCVHGGECMKRIQVEDVAAQLLEMIPVSAT